MQLLFFYEFFSEGGYLVDLSTGGRLWVEKGSPLLGSTTKMKPVYNHQLSICLTSNKLFSTKNITTTCLPAKVNRRLTDFFRH